MKKRIKRTAIVIAFIIFFCFAANIILNIIISSTVTEAELKKDIISYFEKNIGRSVKISSVRYGFFQNIVIDEMKISSSNDFNDFESFLKITGVEISLSKLALLKGDIIIDKIIVIKPHIKITKKFGKTYNESFELISGEKIKAELLKKITEIKRISIEDAIFEYTENFEKDNVVLIFDDISADIRRTGMDVFCNVSGKMKSSADSEKNEISLESVFVLDNYENIVFQKTNIETENINLKDFQPYKSLLDLENVSFRGNASVDHSFSIMNGIFEIDTNLKLINLFISERNGSQIRNLLENESVSASFRGEFGLRKSIEAVIVSDSGINIKAAFASTGTVYSKRYFAGINSKKIDLTKLSKYLTLKNPVKYNGNFTLEGLLYYRSGADLPDISDFTVSADKITVSDIFEGKRINIIDDMSFKLTGQSNTIELSGNYNTKSTALNFNYSSDVMRLFPFAANSRVSLNFDKTDYSALNDTIIFFKNYIGSEISSDRQIGYNQEYFRDRLFGKILLSNSFEAEINCKSLNLSGNASLKNLSIQSSLDKGIFRATLSQAEGYSAKYAFNTVGYMNADMPLIKSDLSIENFDLSSFWKDTGFNGRINSGILNAKSVIEIAAYRASHFADNSKISFEADIKAESIGSMPFQVSLSSVLKNDGFKPNVEQLNNFTFNYSIDAAGGNIYLKTLSLKSDLLSISGYGTFSDKGLSSPLSCSFYDDESVSREWKTNLLSPVSPTAFMISYQSNGRDRSVNLFHID
ncbi:MAG: hypothetical protein KA015_01060 [Spirochaetes bacterium]|nr:hypothetical protein [Spirochaetota bacterium]